MADFNDVDKLLVKLRGLVDADKKVDCLTELEAELKSGTSLQDPDAATGILKQCLRAPQHALSAATVSFLPFYLTLIYDASSTSVNPLSQHHVRSALTAFLTPGGGSVLDRLSDAREKVREAAKSTLLESAKAALVVGGGKAISKASGDRETAMGIFERCLREGGLGAKNWKVREQSLHVFPLLRTLPAFPLRPYVPALVGLLEDSDGTVRDVARHAVISVFSPASAAAKTDLKNTIEKKGVRKSIAEAVLSAVFSHPSAATAVKEGHPASTGSDKGSSPAASSTNLATAAPEQVSDGPSSGAAPRSGAATPTTGPEDNLDPVYVGSRSDLERQFAAMLPFFQGKETEHNWSSREQSVVKLRRMLRGQVHVEYPDAFLAGLKSCQEGLLKTLASLRTTVSMNAISLIRDLATYLGPAIDCMSDTLLSNLLRMASFTKKIIAAAAQAAVAAILEAIPPHAKVINQLVQTAGEKNVQSRVYGFQHIATVLRAHCRTQRGMLEQGGGLDTIQNSIKKGLGDANKDVREKARATFWAFHAVWPGPAQAMMAKLDGVAQKQLQLSAPDGPDLAVIDSAKSTPKRTNIRAAIAARGGARGGLASKPGTPRAATLRQPAPKPSPGQLAEAEATPLPPSPTPSSSGSPRARARSPQMSPPSRPLSFVGSASPTARMSTAQPSTTTRPLSLHGGKSSSGLDVSRLSNTPQGSHSVIRPSLRGRSPSGGSSGMSPMMRPSPLSRSRGPSDMEYDAMASTPTAGRGLLGSATSPTPTPGRDLMDLGSDDDTIQLAAKVPLPSDALDGDSFYGQDLISFSSSPSARNQALPRAMVGRRVLERDSTHEDVLRKEVAEAHEEAGRFLDLMGTSPPASSASQLTADRTTPPGKPPVSLPSVTALSSSVHTAHTPARPAMDGEAIEAEAYSPFGAKPIRADSSNSQPTNWFLRKAMRLDAMSKGSPLTRERSEVQAWIKAILEGSADVQTFRKLRKLSKEQRIAFGTDSEDTASSDGHTLVPGANAGATDQRFAEENEVDDEFSAWREGRLFEELFAALQMFLRETGKAPDARAAAITLLQSLVDHEFPLFAGHEHDLLFLLFDLRKETEPTMNNGTFAIIQSWARRTDPILGLGSLQLIMQRSLAVSASDAPVRLRLYTFGLDAMATVMGRLPAVVLEDELPRVKGMLKEALNDSNVALRMSTIRVIVACHKVMQDETQLFTLLAPLSRDQTNLLTYYAAKG